MLKLNEIRNVMKKMNVTQIAKDTGLEYWRARSVLRSSNPRYFDVEKVSDYIEGIMKNVSHETIQRGA